MSLLFPYVRVSINRPAILLGGQMYRSRPLVRVTLVGTSGTYVEYCLLDTGADDAVFPDVAAIQAGINLANAPAGAASSVGLVSHQIRYARVTLRITDGIEFCEWDTMVGFTSAPLGQPLMGRAGFLQFFDADFRGGREEVELVANSLYPGRSGRLVP
jgi:hypothetical protein